MYNVENLQRLQMEVKKKKLEIPGGRGSTKYPLEWKFQGVEGFKLKNHPWGVWIFSGITHCNTRRYMYFYCNMLRCFEGVCRYITDTSEIQPGQP